MSPLRAVENSEKNDTIEDLKLKLEQLEKARVAETDKTAFQPLYPKIAELDKVLEEKSTIPPIRSSPSSFSPEILEMKAYYEKQRAKKIEMLQNLIKPKEPADSFSEVSNKLTNSSATQKKEEQKVPPLQLKLQYKEDSKVSKTKGLQEKQGGKTLEKSGGDKSPLDKSPVKKKISVIKEEEEENLKLQLPSPSAQQLKTDESETINKRDREQPSSNPQEKISKQESNNSVAKEKKIASDGKDKQPKNEASVSNSEEHKAKEQEQETSKKEASQNKTHTTANKSQQESNQQPTLEKKDSQKPKIKRPNSQMAALNASERTPKVSENNDHRLNAKSQAFSSIETVTSIVIDKNNPSLVQSQKAPSMNQSSQPFQSGFSQPFGIGGFNATSAVLFKNPSTQAPTSTTTKQPSPSNIEKSSSEPKKPQPVSNFLQNATGILQKPIFAVNEIDDDFPDF